MKKPVSRWDRIAREIAAQLGGDVFFLAPDTSIVAKATQRPATRSKTEPVTIEECDAMIAKYVELRDNPKSDPERCRAQIDRWLDVRLALMQAREDAAA